VSCLSGCFFILFIVYLGVFTDCSAGWLIIWLVGSLVVWLVGWLVGLFVGWLVCLLVGWLVGWLL
jgi:hypothetical protein